MRCSSRIGDDRASRVGGYTTNNGASRVSDHSANGRTNRIGNHSLRTGCADSLCDDRTTMGSGGRSGDDRACGISDHATSDRASGIGDDGTDSGASRVGDNSLVTSRAYCLSDKALTTTMRTSVGRNLRQGSRRGSSGGGGGHHNNVRARLAD